MQSVVNIVALKKPSQYFKKDTASVDESILENSSPTQLNTFSDAFDSFKKNLNKIEVLSEFSDTLDNYRINVERVNHLSEKVEGIQKDIQSLLKKEDLDRAMMSQLLVVEQSIRDVQSKVKSINENKLTEIRLDVSSLTNSVSEFLEVEVPKYKKLIVDSELRTNNRYEELENDVNKTLEGIGEFVESKYQHLTETLQGINQQSLASILEDFRILDENFSKLKEEDIPRYKGFIVETERKTENKLEEINSQVLESLSSFEEKIDSNIEKNHSEISNIVESLEKKIVKFENKDLPKYKKTIVESEKKTEEKLNDFNAVLEKTVNSLMEKISLVEGNKVDLIKTVNDKIQEVVSLRDLVVDELEKNESSRDDLKKKVTDLEIEIVRNESHIQVQNKNLEKIQEEVFSAIKSINLEEIEEKSYDLSKKVKYLEEVFEKFNEKEILNENIIVDPPSTDNKDPITPLDKNFVTIEQLQQHYRLFINRIQQQLATIGGGGETRLKYLDDIVGIATNPSAYDGKYLKYDHSIQKFEFVTVNADSSNWTENSYGIYTNSNVGVGTDLVTSPFTLSGNALITGIVTATDFNSTSDVKFKENVNIIVDPIDKILKIDGVGFNWKNTGKKSLGVIAQQVEKVLPELVSGGDDKTVNYNGIVGLLIECIKQQHKEIQEIKKIIDK